MGRIIRACVIPTPRPTNVQGFFLGGEFLHHTLPNVHLLDWDGLARAAAQQLLHSAGRPCEFCPDDGRACANSFAAIRKMAACEWSTPRTSNAGGCQRSGIADESRLQLAEGFCRRLPRRRRNSPRASRFPARISVAWKNGAHGAVIEAKSVRIAPIVSATTESPAKSPRSTSCL